ncbi:MAG: hypothetical protein V4478_00620 [Patescibacteria group bacterium]
MVIDEVNEKEYSSKKHFKNNIMCKNSKNVALRTSWYYEPELLGMAPKVLPIAKVENLIMLTRGSDFMNGYWYCVPSEIKGENYYIYAQPFVNLFMKKMRACRSLS